MKDTFSSRILVQTSPRKHILIFYYLPQEEYVTMKIFNLQKEKIWSMQQGKQRQGKHAVKWNSNGEYDHLMKSGVYVYAIRSSENCEKGVIVV